MQMSRRQCLLRSRRERQVDHLISIARVSATLKQNFEGKTKLFIDEYMNVLYTETISILRMK